MSTNPEWKRLPLLRGQQCRDDLREEAALFGWRWSYYHLKKIYIKHAGNPETAVAQNRGGDPILRPVGPTLAFHFIFP